MIARRRLLACAPLAALAACSSGPPTNYYKLAVMPGPVIQTPPLGIVIRPISIPEYLDQTGVAKPGTSYQTGVYANELWGEPLPDLLRDTLVRELAQRLPSATILGSGGAIATPVGLVLEVNVLAFDQSVAGLVTLDAQFAFKAGPERDVLPIQTIALSVGVTEPGAPGSVAAMSSLWGGAADRIARYAADQTLRMPPG